MAVSIIERRLIGRQRRNRLTIQLDTGAAMAPVPSLDEMGLVRELQHLNVLDQSGESYWRYDGSQLIHIGPGPAAQLISAEAVGW